METITILNVIIDTSDYHNKVMTAALSNGVDFCIFQVPYKQTLYTISYKSGLERTYNRNTVPKKYEDVITQLYAIADKHRLDKTKNTLLKRQRK